MRDVSVQGLRLYVEEVGAGSPLIIQHGLFGSVASTNRKGPLVADLAANGFRVVQYDARGHGRSDLALRSADYRWDALAEELLGVMDVLELPRASIFGTSMGAGAAIVAALRAPERIERLILRMPPPMGKDLRRVRMRLGALSALYRFLGPGRAVSVLAALGQQTTADLLREQPTGLVVPAIDGLIFGKPQLPEQRVTEIRCPALILTHPGDPEHPLRSGEVLSQISGSKLRVGPTRGYWRTNSEAVAPLVTSFLRGEPC